MDDDIHKRLKDLEEQHVRAVRALEKLTKALDHVHAARSELASLAKDEGNLRPALSDLPEQLRLIEDTLSEEISISRGYILDVEIDQHYLRKRLHGEGEDQKRTP